MNKIRILIQAAWMALCPSRAGRETIQDVFRGLGRRGWHGAFECLARRIDPDLSFTSLQGARKEFLDEPYGGGGTLAAHRRIRLGTDDWLEKVYFKNGTEWDRSKRVYEEHAEALHQAGVRIPALCDRREGNRLVAAYFEFLPFVKTPKADIWETGKALATRLATLPSMPAPRDHSFLEMWRDDQINQAVEPLIRDHITRAGGGEGAKAFVVGLNDAAGRLPWRLAHADMNKDNMGAGHMLIDWDRAAVYPVGYDVGYIIGEAMYHQALDTSGAWAQAVDEGVSLVAAADREAPAGDVRVVVCFVALARLLRKAPDRSEAITWLLNTMNQAGSSN